MFDIPSAEYLSDVLNYYSTIININPEKFEICLFGYIIRRKDDGATWGTNDWSANYMFTRKEFAEATLRAIDFDGSWEIVEVGCIDLEKLRK